MKRLLLLTLCIGSVLAFLAASSPDLSPQNRWTPLFTGKDLTGWTPKFAGYPAGENFGNTFRVRNKILSTRYDQYDSFNNRFGALYFNKDFTNYSLRFQYRFTGKTTAGAPSWGFEDGGIQYHGQAPNSVALNQLFPVCLEYNILGSTGGKGRATGEICASGMNVNVNGQPNTSYCTPPTVARPFEGGKWVTAQIDVRSDTITHYVNGEQILQFTSPRYNPNHPLGKAFINGRNDKVTHGYISIQSNSHPMDFRKIEIMEYR